MRIAFRMAVLTLLLLTVNQNFCFADTNLATGTGMDSGSGGNAKTKSSYGSEKKFNFSFEPIVLLVGLVNVNLDMKLNDSWTFGPTFSYWRVSVASGDPVYTDKLSLSVFALGARGSWYANGVFQDGWYVSPVLQYVNAKVSTISAGQDLSASVSLVELMGLVGYNWFWDSFNMRLGGGINLATGPSKVHVQSSNSTYSNDVSYNPSSVGLAFDFMIGWTF